MRRVRIPMFPSRRLMRDTRGASAVEYGLILALIVLAMFVGLVALARTTTDIWNDLDAAFRAAAK